MDVYNIPTRLQNNYDDEARYALITIILFNNSTRLLNTHSLRDLYGYPARRRCHPEFIHHSIYYIRNT